MLMAIYALYGVAALLALAPIAVVLAASPHASNVIYGASLIVTLTLGVIGFICLSGRTVSIATLPLGLPWLGAHCRIDGLSGFFIIVVNLGGAAASLFALGYGRHEEAPQRVLPFYPAYLAAMNLVVLADDAFSFLVSWEFMSLSSWALVVAHHRERENLRAGYVYLLMASFGTLALLLAFGLLAGANGNYAFDAIRASHPSAALAALVLVLTIVGAGSKAGVVPLHAWLPLAHPAAPSHVSALMSGVMTKVAVYGFVRI
ncbi:MAG: proton-conducting transporter membrane subunit, partial [Pseudolabrys sp.]